MHAIMVYLMLLQFKLMGYYCSCYAFVLFYVHASIVVSSSIPYYIIFMFCYAFM